MFHTDTFPHIAFLDVKIEMILGKVLKGRKEGKGLMLGLFVQLCATLLAPSSSAASNCLPERMQSYIGCICLAFLQYVGVCGGGVAEI